MVQTIEKQKVHTLENIYASKKFITPNRITKATEHNMLIYSK